MKEELIKIIDERIAELEKDYQNIITAINRLDQDKSDFITRGVTIRGGISELQQMKQKFNENNIEADAVPVQTQDTASIQTEEVAQ